MREHHSLNSGLLKTVVFQKFIIFFEAYLGPELQRELCRSHLIAKTVNFLSARFMYDSSCIPQSSENWACSEEALNKY